MNLSGRGGSLCSPGFLLCRALWTGGRVRGSSDAALAHRVSWLVKFCRNIVKAGHLMDTFSSQFMVGECLP
jgi:hypothetical protein